MEILLITLLLVILVGSAIGAKAANKTQKNPRIYHYEKKLKVMTDAEGRFFEKLTNVIGERFIILPQAHLSAFINHKIKGQNWKAAFNVINGKSVDFLLVEKNTLKPVAAIELDDWSHAREERVARDEKVKNILDEAGILLVRFDNPDTSEQTIVDKFYQLVQGKG
jgi:very-short-patch-repair endonuclease